MEFNQSLNYSELKLDLKGRFTFSDYAIMLTITKLLKKGSITKVIIDCSKLDFIDSSGIGMILILNEEIAKFGGKIFIHNPKVQVQRVLTFSKILDLLK